MFWQAPGNEQLWYVNEEMTVSQKNPALFLSFPHACGYLPDRKATTLFIDPQLTLNAESYNYFLRHGFRRSGNFVYRPHCQNCSACIPVRVDVNGFTPSRSQRRVWKKNRDLSVQSCAPGFRQEHFDLYLRYQAGRHPGGAMNDSSTKKYMEFLVTRHVPTCFYELRVKGIGGTGRLLGVAVADILPDGLSAIYTFYDPDESRRGLGVFAILWEIQEARRLGLPWVYLGYLIKESPKMAYKADYCPLEAYRNGHWSGYSA